jgi:hypothetical protein
LGEAIKFAIDVRLAAVGPNCEDVLELPYELAIAVTVELK